jgi:hypothetical protein
MATFKELKQKFMKTDTLSEEKPLAEPVKNNLELEETRYLLGLIAKSDFSGKDIQIVYNIALKLQNILTSHLNKNE